MSSESKDEAQVNEKPDRVLPVFIVQAGTMSDDDIKRLESMAGLIVVQSEAPDAIRLLEPPLERDVPAQAQAALQLFRYIKNTGGNNNTTFYKADLIRWFIDALMDAPPVPRVPKVKRQ